MSYIIVIYYTTYINLKKMLSVFFTIKIVMYVYIIFDLFNWKSRFLASSNDYNHNNEMDQKFGRS